MPRPGTNVVRVWAVDINLSANALKMNVNTISGVYTGSVRAGIRTVRIDGALFQDLDIGRGYFLGTNRSGRVLIQPLP